MQIIPVADVYGQTVSCTVNNQSVLLRIRQVSTGLFMDVTSGGSLVIGGVICENLNRIVRDVYRGFIGDFAWIDTQGSDDPSSPGLGSRFVLAYLTPSELAGSNIT